MNVLYVVNDLSSGGAEKLVSDMITSFKKIHDMSIDLFIMANANSRYYETLKEQGVTIHISKYNNTKNLLNIFQIRKLIRKNKYDIIHVHLFPSLYYVALSRFFNVFTFKKSTTKYVYTEHSTHNKRRNKKIFAFIERVIYKRYDLIVSISEGTKQNLLSWLKAKDTKGFLTINNGIELERFKTPKGLNCMTFDKHSDFVVGMVGRFTNAKDHHTLIEAMKQLPLSVSLVLVGEGTKEEEIKQQIEENDLGDRVFLPGYISDIPSFLNSIDVYVQSSHWEGFGLAAIEAMACRKPTIVTNVPGLIQTVGDSALSFEVGDDVELARLILQLKDNKHLYEEYAGKALKLSEKYDIKNMIDCYYNHYQELTNKK